jgi:Secretion system C-terminal sorting domain
MKKILFVLLCFTAFFEAQAQVFNLKSLPSSGVIFRKEGWSQVNIDIRNSMPMGSTLAVKYEIRGKNPDAMVNTDLESFSNGLLYDTIQFNNNDTVRRFSFKAKLDGINEGNDTFIFKLTQAVTSGSIGTPDSVLIVVGDSVAAPITGRPLYTIGVVRGSNKDGVPDSLNKTCSIRGTLYGINRRTTGYQMFICDGTGCMGIFSGKTYSILPTVIEGDSVEISGIIDQFRGLGQIRFNSTGDTIRKLGFRTINSPQTVTSLNENTEARLVKVEGLSLFSGTWFADSAFDLILKNTSGTQFSVRIENKPSTNFSAPAAIKSGEIYTITGMGTQFDPASSAPYTAGYQLLPRKLSDILKTGTGGGGGSSISNISQNEISIFPTLVSNAIHLYFESASKESGSIQIIDMQGKVVKSEKIQIVNGENLISIDQLENLTSGSYFIQLQSASFQLNKQFSKVE